MYVYIQFFSNISQLTNLIDTSISDSNKNLCCPIIFLKIKFKNYLYIFVTIFELKEINIIFEMKEFILDFSNFQKEYPYNNNKFCMLKKIIINIYQQRSKDWISPWQTNETQSFDLQNFKNIALEPPQTKNKSRKIKLKLKNSRNNKLSLSERLDKVKIKSLEKNLMPSSKQSLLKNKFTKKDIDFNEHSKSMIRNSPDFTPKFQIQEKSLSSNIMRISCNTNRKLMRKPSSQNDIPIRYKNFRKSIVVHEDQKQKSNFVRSRCLTVDK